MSKSASDKQEQFQSAYRLFKSGKSKEAEEALLSLIKEGTELAPKVRMTLAQLYLDTKRHKEAEELLRRETERLLSPERKCEIAGIYLQLADVASNPSDDVHGLEMKADFNKALSLFDFLLQMDLPRKLKGKILIKMGRTALAGKNYSKAANVFLSYLSLFDPLYLVEVQGRQPGSCEAQSMGENVVEARLGIVRAKLLEANALPSLDNTEEIAGHASTVDDFTITLLDNLIKLLRMNSFKEQRDLDECPLRQALFYRPLVAGLCREFSPLAIGGDGPTSARRAVNYSYDFIDLYPNEGQTLELMRLVPHALDKAGFQDEALEAWQRLLDGVHLKLADKALQARLKYFQARAKNQLGEALYGSASYEEALETWQDYLSEYPDGEDWGKAQEGVYRAMGAIGLAALTKNMYEKCRGVWINVASKRGLAAEAGWLHLAVSFTYLVEAKELKKEEKTRKASELFKKALDEMGTVAHRYPGEVAQQARLRRAEIYRFELDDLASAVREYGLAGNSQARQALSELTAVELTLESPRVFRSQEDAFVLLKGRNVEKVSIRRYPINLEDYYKKYHTSENVNRLDLDLVSPDKTWQVDIPGYEKYRDIEHKLDVGVDSPGTYAVTVEGKDFETTVLVIKSDIEIITATTAKEAVVLVKNQLTDEPVEGATVTVWAGERSGQTIEMKTGDDGVAHQKFSEIPNEKPYVFARFKEHVAVVGGNKPSSSTVSLQPKGFVYTSRPVFLPGEIVHCRGIIRVCPKGSYEVEEGQSYLVTLNDPNGRSIATKEVVLSKYGTFTADFSMPESAALGTYQTLVKSMVKGTHPVYTCSFTVQHVQPAKMFIELTPSVAAALAGDKIDLAIKAAYYTGAPLAERVVNLSLPDGRLVSLTTDEAGFTSYELDTTPYFRQDTLGLAVELPGEDARASAFIPLLPAALKMEVSLPDRKYEVGERLDVPLLLMSPDDKALVKQMIEVAAFVSRAAPEVGIPRDICTRAGLDFSRFSNADEAKVFDESLETDGDGRALFSLSLEEPGETRLTFAAKDSAGRELIITRKLTVEKPASPELNISVGRATFLVGDTCDLELESKEADGLGLLLYTADTIITYKVHKFRKGKTKHSFLVASEHSPNLNLIALATGMKQLYRADQPIEVRRKLSLSLELPDRPLSPGEEFQAYIVARDGQGAPVATEFSLAMVDKGLLAKHPDATPSIVEFFEEGTKRKVQVTAFSSISFFRRGHKRAIAKEVLREVERMEDDKKDKEKAEGRRRGARASAPKKKVPPKPLMKQLATGMNAPGGGGGKGFSNFNCDSPTLEEAPGEAGEVCFHKGFEEIDCSTVEGYGRDDKPSSSSASPEREELAIGAFWVGCAETDEDGKGQVTVKVPERTSSYRFLVHGVTIDTLVGQIEDERVVRKDLYVDVKMPTHLLEGDELLPVYTVHNAGSYVGPLSLDVSLVAGLVKKQETIEVDVKSRGVFSMTSSSIMVPVAEELTISVQAKARDKTVDRLVKRANVRPYGVSSADGRAGKLADHISLELNLPNTVRPETLRLAVDLSVNVDEDVLAFMDGPHWDLGLTATACRVYALSRLCILLSGGAQCCEKHAIWRSQLDSAISSLISSQNDDGSWPFIVARDRRHLNGDLSTTAWSVIALEGAIKAGLFVDTSARDHAINWLQAKTSSFESLAEQEALLAMAVTGAVEFSPLNRLNRNQSSLSNEGKALLGLAFNAFGKDGYAKPLAESLASRSDLPVLAKALTVMLMDCVGGMDEKRNQLANDLRQVLLTQSLCGNHRWLAIAALASKSNGKDIKGMKEGGSLRFLVTALINDKELGTFAAPENDSAHFVLSGEDITLPAKVEFRYQGRGECAYRLVLSGFTSQIEETRQLKTTIHRENYYHSPRLYKGRKLVDSQMRVHQLTSDDFVEDKIDFISRTSGLSPSQYMVVTRPLPAGLVVDTSSLPSRALHVRQEAGKLTMVFAGNPTGFRIRLLPFCPGNYRVMPASLSSAENPRICDHLDKERTLRILAPGQEDETPYSWTQHEHIEFGRAHFNDGEYEDALKHLRPLPKDVIRNWKDVVRALLWIYSMDAYYEPKEVVDLFETVEQKYSSIVIPYDKLLAVGRAYHDTGEDEAACLLWRSTMSSSFRDDIPVAQELESAGEYLRSVSYLRDLYWQYPSLPMVVESLYGLSQDVYTHKDNARQFGDELSPNDLVGMAVELLHEFLTFHSEEPYADEAFFSLLNAYRELGMNDLCLDKALEAATTFEKSQYVDRYRYIRALAAFHLGKYEEAIEAAAAVAGSESEDGNYATFILGQMYQAIGETQKSLEAYRKVQSEFSDAQLSINFLNRRFLTMPEVVSGVPGESIAVEISYCNVTSIEVLAYRVDLMRLFLKEKNLDRIAGVKLAGITPTCTFEREVPRIPSGTTGVARIELPFEKVGAYLVLVRASEAFASGLALITPLTMEVQELHGAARATVLEGKERKAAASVYTKCSDGYSFTSGKTDLRGAVTLAADSGERVTLVARRGEDEYAFYRSTKTNVDDSKLCLDAFEEVSYDQGIRSANLMVQQRVASKLRSNYKRRSKNAMGLQASMVRK